MNINLRLTGELEAYIESLIKRGFAANKTEAARMLIAKQYSAQVQNSDFELDGWQRNAAKLIWNNPKDDAAQEFYARKYLNAKKR
jgi:Arc/MetJ-type ribon-helix-helix transcriptional regulator